MIVGFDGTILQTPKTGIGYYTQLLIQHLMAESDVVIRAYDGLCMKAPNLPAASDLAPPSPSLLRIRLSRMGPARSAWRFFKAAGFRRASRGVDLFHATNFLPPTASSLPTLPLIHDVSHLRHPEWHPAERVRWLEARAKEFRKAPLINTVSRFSAREITATLGVPAEKIRVTYPGVNPFYLLLAYDDEELLRDADLRPGEFFLCVGTLEPRKNLATAICAYDGLPLSIKARFPLVIVGPTGWGDLKLPGSAENLKRQGILRFMGYIEERLMGVLYRQCAALLYPSSYEGFGMPVSEAMASGSRPVVARGGATEEVAGELGLAIDAFDPDAWRLAMMRAIDEGWYKDTERRRRLKEAGSRFSWSGNAWQTRQIYDELLHETTLR